MNIYEQAEYDLATTLGWTDIQLVGGTGVIRTPSLIGTNPQGKMLSDVPAYARHPFQTTSLIAEYELDLYWAWDKNGYTELSAYNTDIDDLYETHLVKDHATKILCVSYTVAKIVNKILLYRKNHD